MGLFDKIFSDKSIQENKNPEHAVIVRFNYGIQGLDTLHELECKLIKVIENASAGEYDGHEIALDNSDGFLYMYGPNAETLFKTVKPILEDENFMKGAIATLRFGPPGEDTSRIEVVI